PPALSSWPASAGAPAGDAGRARSGAGSGRWNASRVRRRARRSRSGPAGEDGFPRRPRSQRTRPAEFGWTGSFDAKGHRAAVLAGLVEVRPPRLIPGDHRLQRLQLERIEQVRGIRIDSRPIHGGGAGVVALLVVGAV